MRTLQTLLSISLTLLFAVTTTAKIVFTEGGIINGSIYVMDDDGGNIKRITDDTTVDWSPRWSPNGRKIAFKRDIDPHDSTSKSDVYIMNADGSNAQHISRYTRVITDIAFTPDGSQLYYNLVLGIKRVDLNAIDLDRIEPHLLPITHVYQLDISPDGKRIVYVNDDHDVLEKNLWFIDVDGGEPTVWTEPDPERGEMHRLNPRWSPDGEKILYTEIDINVETVEHEDGGRATKIWNAGTFRYVIQNIDDGATQVLNIPDNLAPNSVDWMDGQKTVLLSASDFDEFQRTNRSVSKIYKYDIASEELTYLADGSHADWHDGPLSVSPIGKQSVRWGELKRSYVEP